MRGRPGSVRHVWAPVSLEDGGQTVEGAEMHPEAVPDMDPRLPVLPLKGQGGSGEREEEEAV